MRPAGDSPSLPRFWGAFVELYGGLMGTCAAAPVPWPGKHWSPLKAEDVGVRCVSIQHRKLTSDLGGMGWGGVGMWRPGEGSGAEASKQSPTGMHSESW